MFASGFSWFRLIPAVDHDVLLEKAGLLSHWLEGHEVAHTYVYLHAWLACGFFLFLAVLARMGLQKASSRQGLERFFASESLDARTGAEMFATGIRGMMAEQLDKKDVRAFFLNALGDVFLNIAEQFATNVAKNMLANFAGETIGKFLMPAASNAPLIASNASLAASNGAVAASNGALVASVNALTVAQGGTIPAVTANTAATVTDATATTTNAAATTANTGGLLANTTALITGAFSFTASIRWRRLWRSLARQPSRWHAMFTDGMQSL
jgi:hypothetical protein